MKTFKDLKFIWFFRSPKVCSKAEVTLNNHKIEVWVNSDDGYEVFIESLPELNKEYCNEREVTKIMKKVQEMGS